jgi:hypothetical protein
MTVITTIPVCIARNSHEVFFVVEGMPRLPKKPLASLEIERQKEGGTWKAVLSFPSTWRATNVDTIGRNL